MVSVQLTFEASVLTSRDDMTRLNDCEDEVPFVTGIDRFIYTDRSC